MAGAQVIALKLIASSDVPSPPPLPDLPQSITDLISDLSYQLDLQLNQTSQENFLAHPYPNAKWRGRECNCQ